MKLDDVDADLLDLRKRLAHSLKDARFEAKMCLDELKDARLRIAAFKRQLRALNRLIFAPKEQS